MHNIGCIKVRQREFSAALLLMSPLWNFTPNFYVCKAHNWLLSVRASCFFLLCFVFFSLDMSIAFLNKICQLLFRLKVWCSANVKNLIRNLIRTNFNIKTNIDREIHISAEIQSRCQNLSVVSLRRYFNQEWMTILSCASVQIFFLGAKREETCMPFSDANVHRFRLKTGLCTAMTCCSYI